MKQYYLYSICILVMLLQCGCASIVTGKMQEIPVTSEPTGAKVTADNNTTVVAPGTIVLLRNKSYTVTAEHECCGSQEILLDNRVSNWFWANAILGGGIGMIIDMSSGACDELFPKELHFDFSPEALANAQRRKEFLKANPDIKNEFRWAISNGIIAKEMTREMVLASAGEPDEINQHGGYEQFVYNNFDTRTYYFNKKGILKKTGEDWFMPK